jgi:DHA1 family arabinose polymer transporter-like MFS transporter
MVNNKDKSPLIRLSLVSLLIGGLSVGMTEFLMMGVLPDVSRTLNVSIPEAGYLISIYALGVVIGAPLMVGLAGNYPPRKVLIGLMMMVFIFNGLFAIAPTYSLLLTARFLAGLPHGAFFGSKLTSDKMSKDMAVWSDKDITAHQTWISSKIDNLKKTFLI